MFGNAMKRCHHLIGEKKWKSIIETHVREPWISKRLKIYWMGFDAVL